MTIQPGQLYGELKILSLHKKSRNGGASWICQCSCGRKCIATGSQLLAGKKKCGDCNYGHYSFCGEMAECILPNGEKFQIDAEDYPLVSCYKWVRNNSGYFVASQGHRNHHVLLHRLVMNASGSSFVDHIDGDKNNCRKNNLRFCTQTENNRNIGLQHNNRCGIKGVYWAKDRQKWRAEITVDQKHIHIGSYDTAVEAAIAYDRAAQRYFGEFSRTNAMLAVS